MKKLRTLMFLIGVSLLIGACGGSTWIVPPYTNAEKIIELDAGMSISKVNNVLGIPPFDIYHMQEDGSTILIYNYRFKNRKMRISSDDAKHKEEAQTAGDLWYSSNSAIVYVLFKDGKMTSLITDAGREESEAILITENTIRLLSKEELKLMELAKLRKMKAESAPKVEVLIPLPTKKNK